MIQPATSHLIGHGRQPNAPSDRRVSTLAASAARAGVHITTNAEAPPPFGPRKCAASANAATKMMYAMTRSRAVHIFMCSRLLDAADVAVYDHSVRFEWLFCRPA